MKKLLLVSALVLVFAAVGSAQVSKPYNIYAGGGIGMPMSPDGFKDFHKMGLHGTGGFGLNLPAVQGFQILGLAEYHSFSYDWDEAGMPDASGGTLGALMFSANGKMGFGVPAAPIKPFVMGGLGIANLSISDEEIPGEPAYSYESESKFYINLGGGAEFKVGPSLGIFVMARYVSVFTEGESTAFIPITAGIMF